MRGRELPPVVKDAFRGQAPERELKPLTVKLEKIYGAEDNSEEIEIRSLQGELLGTVIYKIGDNGQVAEITLKDRNDTTVSYENAEKMRTELGLKPGLLDARKFAGKKIPLNPELQGLLRL